MTKNQIDYAKLLEEQRSNRENERLTADRDATNRELGFANYYEAARHNKATEQHNSAVLGETIRSNQEKERYNLLSLEETSRHNLAVEEHNANTLKETNRHNVAVESLQSGQLQVSLGQLEVARQQQAEQSRHNLATELETYRSNSAREVETYRSNLAKETETQRSNLARETETSRANRAQESLSQLNINLGYAKLNEQARATDLNYALGSAQLVETMRSNASREYETYRHNISSEQNESVKRSIEQQQSDRNYQLELKRQAQNALQIAETKRSNLENEQLKAATLQYQRARSRYQNVESIFNSITKIVPVLGLGG